MEECPEGQRCPGQLDDLQRQPPQSKRAVHSDIWKIMQKVSMDEKGTYRRWKQGRAAWEEQRHNLNTMDRIKNLERLWSLHSWRYSELGWIWFWGTSSKLALCCAELNYMTYKGPMRPKPPYHSIITETHSPKKYLCNTCTVCVLLHN